LTTANYVIIVEVEILVHHNPCRRNGTSYMTLYDSDSEEKEKETPEEP